MVEKSLRDLVPKWDNGRDVMWSLSDVSYSVTTWDGSRFVKMVVGKSLGLTRTKSAGLVRAGDSRCSHELGQSLGVTIINHNSNYQHVYKKE